MLKFGASTLSWISHWTTEGAKYAIAQTSKYGFDLLEISLTPAIIADREQLKKDLLSAGVEPRFSMILPKECHLPAYPDKALELLKAAIDTVEFMEGDFLGGVLYSAIGVFTGKTITDQEKATVQQVLSEIATYAAPKGIVIALEPINRYETYVFNSSEQVLELCKQIQAPNVGLMLDTFHMNIEENGFYDPVIHAGSALKYLHITESDRGVPGEGNVRWDDLFKGLAEIHYQGDLVLENFSSFVPGMAEATSLWRPSKYDGETLAKKSLEFLKAKTSKWGMR